jgi:hypothetical protein
MGFLASYIALWVAVLFLFFVAIGLLREVTQLRRSQRAATNLEQLRIGHTAPTFSLQEVYSGETLSSKIFFGRPTSFLFLSPGCSICRSIAAEAPALARELEATTTIAVICLAEEEGWRNLLPPLRGMTVLLDADAEVSVHYGISRYPTVVVLDEAFKVLRYGYPRSIRQLAESISLGSSSSEAGSSREVLRA